jgi:septal ring factor EnvC (AmiA/AmiB activator)
MDKKISAEQRELGELEQNRRLVEKNIVRLQAALTVLGSQEVRLDGLLKSRLVLMLRQRLQSPWLQLLASPSLSEFFTRLRFHHILALQNAELIRRLQRQQATVRGRTRELAAEAAKVKTLQAQSQAVLRRHEYERASRAAVYEEIRASRELQGKAVRELEGARRKLADLIRNLEKRASRLESRLSGLAAPSQGRLPWPLSGGLATRFGRIKHPRFNTYLTNKGIDIKGRIGQNVRTVAAGRVLFADWFEGFGQMVIIDHGSGVHSVYAHLGSLAVSQSAMVAGGQNLGTLGESGLGGGSVLYFELRRGGVAVDPLLWLEPQ